MRRPTFQSRTLFTAAMAAAAASIGACSLDGSGLLTDDTTSTTSGTGGAAATTTTTTTGTMTTTTSGMGGEGGAVLCTAGDTQPCYSGAAGTEGVGPCIGGTQTCDADGMGFGPCVGEVAPIAEDCATPEDDDCNGTANEAAAGCACDPGATQPCYNGPVGTRLIGVCTGGTTTCDANGQGWGACVGEVLPSQELCATPGDDDCNGQANEGGPDCNCVPGAVASCYSGPVGTDGVGPCVGGTQTCNPDGLGYGACLGETVPVAETCNTAQDDDCDGMTNEEGLGCVCLPNAASACYTGLAGTQNVGLCKGGTSTCNAQGTANGPCLGEIVPQLEQCDGSLNDEDCDNSVNEGGVGCVCVPAVMSACYSGPVGTNGVGPCIGGTQTCNAQGTANGACVGEVLPLPENCTTAADDNCDMVSPTCTGTGVWSRIAGDGASQQGNAVAFDTAGNLIVTGQFVGTVDLGGGDLDASSKNDVFVAKYSATGVHQWSADFGENAKDEYGLGVATDASDNAYFTGYYNGDINFGSGNLPTGGDQVYVAKFNPAGAHQWSRGFGDGPAQRGHGIAVDTSGNVFVTGVFAGVLDFGGAACPAITTAGGNDIFLAKLDGANGNCLWAKRFGDGSAQSGASVAVDGTGHAYITGSFQGTVNFGGGNLTTAGGDDVFLAKLDGGTGAEVWAKKFGNSAAQQGKGVAVSGSTVAVTGQFLGDIDLGGGVLTTAGSDDVFLAVLDTNGVYQWQKKFGDSTQQIGYGVAFDPAGNVMITGMFFGTAVNFGGVNLPNGGSEDIFLVKLDPAGTHLWSKSFGASNVQRGLAIAVDGVGNSAITGLQGGMANYGAGALTSAGGNDIFIAAFTP